MRVFSMFLFVLMFVFLGCGKAQDSNITFSGISLDKKSEIFNDEMCKQYTYLCKYIESKKSKDFNLIYSGDINGYDCCINVNVDKKSDKINYVNVTTQSFDSWDKLYETYNDFVKFIYYEHGSPSVHREAYIGSKPPTNEEKLVLLNNKKFKKCDAWQIKNGTIIVSIAPGDDCDNCGVVSVYYVDKNTDNYLLNKFMSL